MLNTSKTDFIVHFTNRRFLYIGAIFEVGTDEMQAAFRHAVAQFNRMNESVNGRRYELQAFVDIISTADTVKLSRLSESNYFFYRRSTTTSSMR